jgi:AAHS family 3-hydroxyphenylpropionic acid transporter
MADAKGQSKAGLTVFLCFLVALLEGYDIQSFGVVAKRLIAAFSLNSPDQQSLVASGAMIGLIVGAVVGGMLADRVGRKPILIASTAIFGLFSVLTAAAFDYHSLLAVRLLTGLGFGGALPNLIAIATEVAKPSKKASTVAIVCCGMPVGGAIVASLAPVLLAQASWRMIFIIGGVVPLAVLAALFLLPETKPAPDGAPRAGLMMALFGQRRAPATLLLWVTFFMTQVIVYLMLNWLPSLMIDKGYSEANGQTAAFAFNTMSVVGALIVGWVVDRFAFRWPLLIVYLLLAAALYAMAGGRDLPLLLAMAGLSGFTVLSANYILYSVSPGYYPLSARAAGTGAAVAAGRVGSVVGPMIAPQLRAAGFSADQVFLVLIPVSLIAGAACFALTFVDRARRRTPVSLR